MSIFFFFNHTSISNLFEQYARYFLISTLFFIFYTAWFFSRPKNKKWYLFFKKLYTTIFKIFNDFFLINLFIFSTNYFFLWEENSCTKKMLLCTIICTIITNFIINKHNLISFLFVNNNIHKICFLLLIFCFFNLYPVLLNLENLTTNSFISHKFFFFLITCSILHKPLQFFFSKFLISNAHAMSLILFILVNPSYFCTNFFFSFYCYFFFFLILNDKIKNRNFYCHLKKNIASKTNNILYNYIKTIALKLNKIILWRVIFVQYGYLFEESLLFLPTLWLCYLYYRTDFEIFMQPGYLIVCGYLYLLCALRQQRLYAKILFFSKIKKKLFFFYVKYCHWLFFFYHINIFFITVELWYLFFITYNWFFAVIIDLVGKQPAFKLLKKKNPIFLIINIILVFLLTSKIFYEILNNYSFEIFQNNKFLFYSCFLVTSFFIKTIWICRNIKFLLLFYKKIKAPFILQFKKIKTFVKKNI